MEAGDRRGDVVEALGIATNALTKTRTAQVVLIHSFSLDNR
jgi:hypothetical protein